MKKVLLMLSAVAVFAACNTPTEESADTTATENVEATPEAAAPEAAPVDSAQAATDAAPATEAPAAEAPAAEEAPAAH